MLGKNYEGIQMTRTIKIKMWYWVIQDGAKWYVLSDLKMSENGFYIMGDRFLPSRYRLVQKIEESESEEEFLIDELSEGLFIRKDYQKISEEHRKSPGY